MNMKSCIGKNVQINAIVKQARALGMAVNRTSETVVIKRSDGADVYRALKMGSADAWIVRYDPGYFAS